MDEVCDVTRGASPRPINEWIAPTGTPWVKIADATRSSGRTINQTRECILDSGRKHSVVVKPGDLILSNSATPGIPKFMGIEACIHDGWMLLRNFRGALPEFLYYRLLFDRPALVGLGNGSVFTNLKTDILKSHVLDLPSLEEQHRIAGVLGALDDLIEVNRGLIRDLREVARGRLQKCEDSCPLGEIASWGGLPTSSPEGLVEHYSLPSFDDEETPELIKGDQIRSAKQKLGDPCVLVARLNPHIPRVWMTYPSEDMASFASTEFVPLFGKGVETELIYAIVSSESYLANMSGLVTGTTGSHQRIEKSALTQVVVKDPRSLTPSQQIAIADLIKGAESLRRELKELERTRDELLPLLLSGRVRVGDVAA